MSDAYESFQKYFEIVMADTPELIEAVYRIRYQVLCVQNTFPDMNAADYPDKLEKDEYDNHSCHALLRFRASGNFIGAVRLILYDPSQPHKLFPVELNTQLDPELCDIKSLRREQIAEISRSVVIRQFDRRKSNCLQDDALKQATNIITIDCEKRAIRDRRSSGRRSTPHLSLLLMACVLRNEGTFPQSN